MNFTPDELQAIRAGLKMVIDSNQNYVDGLATNLSHRQFDLRKGEINLCLSRIDDAKAALVKLEVLR